MRISDWSSDVCSSDLDGMTLVHLYRTNPVLRDVPILVLSSKEDAAVKSQAFATGAADYLVKLPEPLELVARIRHTSQSYLNMIRSEERLVGQAGVSTCRYRWSQ